MGWVTYARHTGIFVMKPNKKELKPASAAVAVTKDRFKSGIGSETASECVQDNNLPWTQTAYSAFFSQRGSVGSLQTQLPPVSDRIEAFDISLGSFKVQPYVH